MEKITILMKKRLLVFLFLSTVGWMILFGRVVYIQVILGEELQQKAYEQQTRDRLITPKRGSILDRNGVGLAVTETVNSVSVIPVQIKEKEQTAKYLADILELKYDTVLEKIKQNVALVRIKNKVDKDIAMEIRKKEIPGIVIDEDVKRVYPYYSLASQVLGFVGKDNQGIIGLESKYNEYLEGKAGKILTFRAPDVILASETRRGTITRGACRVKHRFRCTLGRRGEEEPCNEESDENQPENRQRTIYHRMDSDHRCAFRHSGRTPRPPLSPPPPSVSAARGDRIVLPGLRGNAGRPCAGTGKSAPLSPVSPSGSSVRRSRSLVYDQPDHCTPFPRQTECGNALQGNISVDRPLHCDRKFSGKKSCASDPEHRSDARTDMISALIFPSTLPRFLPTTLPCFCRCASLHTAWHPPF